jgi:hypothetical protein
MRAQILVFLSVLDGHHFQRVVGRGDDYRLAFNMASCWRNLFKSSGIASRRGMDVIAFLYEFSSFFCTIAPLAGFPI